jgi:hypothetical protein
MYLQRLGVPKVNESDFIAKQWRKEAMSSKITCLVTLHGIGFEQPPISGVLNSGYADPLHQHLKKFLNALLSDDPNRREGRNQPGDNGAIYVESRYKDAQGKLTREEGLKRLGIWCDDHQKIDFTNAPLVEDGAQDGSISHIALVYSNLEPMDPEVGATAISLGMSLASASHYGSVTNLLHTAVVDGLAMIGNHTAVDQEPVSSRPRPNLKFRTVKHLGQQGQAAPTPPPGILASLRNIEDDVACYVCYNEERERVRSFVHEALLRIACRDDVENIVLNTHSNGTVVAFDVLRNLPQQVTKKIKIFVTAGSPLRKYADLFHWGHEIQSRYQFETWYNLWDRCDPVADPLNPPQSWRIGDPIVPSNETLFEYIDLDDKDPFWIKVTDIPVDNVKNSRDGGLKAHNYWDNEEEFVKHLAEIVRSIGETPLTRAA